MTNLTYHSSKVIESSDNLAVKVSHADHAQL